MRNMKSFFERLDYASLRRHNFTLITGKQTNKYMQYFFFLMRNTKFYFQKLDYASLRRLDAFAHWPKRSVTLNSN